MSFTRTIVCLANSKKPHGHCVAGKQQVAGGGWQWIRPVGVTEGREVTDKDIKFEDHSYPRTLDIIEIDFEKTDNHPYQAENLIIDPTTYWVKTGRVSLPDLAALVDRPQTLWEPGYTSTSGHNDRVPSLLLNIQRPSLYLIRPEQMRVTVGAEAAKFNDMRRKVRTHFSYAGVHYSLKLTDPIAEDYYLGKQDGEYVVPNVSYITVSLAEIYNGYAYKVVAAVL